MARQRRVFVNLAVGDLTRSVGFFQELGFEFDPRYTDGRAACMVLSPQGYLMLLERSFFRTFTDREPCDTRRHNEALIALSCDSRAEVDGLVRRALAAGGAPAMPLMDRGFVYARSFYDPDGHHFEVLWMDRSAVPQEMPS